MKEVKEPKTKDLVCAECNKKIGTQTTMYYENENSSSRIRIVTNTKQEFFLEKTRIDKKNYCSDCSAKAEENYQEKLRKEEEQYQRRIELSKERAIEAGKEREARQAQQEKTIAENWFKSKEQEFTGVIGIVIGREIILVLLADGSKHFTNNKEFTTNAPTIFAQKGRQDYSRKDFYKPSKLDWEFSL